MGIYNNSSPNRKNQNIDTIIIKSFKKIMSNRICVLIDNDIDKKLRIYLAKLILKKKRSVILLKTINPVLKNFLDENA